MNTGTFKREAKLSSTSEEMINFQCFGELRDLVKEYTLLSRKKQKQKPHDPSYGYNGLPAVMSTYSSFLKY